MKLPRIIPLLIVLILSACGPAVATSVMVPTSVPSSNLLPDLVVSNVYLGMQGVPGGFSNCVSNYAPFEIRAVIANQGQALAMNIPVIELSAGSEIQIGELPAGQSMEVYFKASSPNGAYNVTVDARNTVPESNENNNTFSYLAITPTPPVLCPPTEIPFPTPVPTSESGASTLSQAVLRNGVYRSPDWGEFQLTDGVYYRTPPTAQESREAYTTRIQDPIFYGDINADGLEDALVILNTQNGGTGHFYRTGSCAQSKRKRLQCFNGIFGRQGGG